MRKGILRRREGSSDHIGLLSTRVGEFSIELTLDYSQTILLSLSVSYNGDNQSRCHEERSKSLAGRRLGTSARSLVAGRPNKNKTFNPLNFGKSKSFSLYRR